MTREYQISGELYDMPINSERTINGHRVERFADGWKVDGQGSFAHENALRRLLS